MIEDVLHTPKAEIYFIEDRILCVRINENVEINREDIAEIQQKKFLLNSTKPHCVLFVPPKIGTLSREARNYSASEEVNKNAIAKAVVTKNLAQRITSNFFIKFNQPPVPTRLFSNESEALDWLNKKMELFDKKRALSSQSETL